MPPTSVTQVQLWPRVICGLRFSRSQPDSKDFSPSSKSTPSQLHLAGFAVLRDHTWIVWRQPWAPSHAFGPIPLSRLILKSPCRERSTKRTFTFTFTTIQKVRTTVRATLWQFRNRAFFWWWPITVCNRQKSWPDRKNLALSASYEIKRVPCLAGGIVSMRCKITSEEAMQRMERERCISQHPFPFSARLHHSMICLLCQQYHQLRKLHVSKEKVCQSLTKPFTWKGGHSTVGVLLAIYVLTGPKTFLPWNLTVSDAEVKISEAPLHIKMLTSMKSVLN